MTERTFAFLCLTEIAGLCLPNVYFFVHPFKAHSEDNVFYTTLFEISSFCEINKPQDSQSLPCKSCTADRFFSQTIRKWRLAMRSRQETSQTNKLLADLQCMEPQPPVNLHAPLAKGSKSKWTKTHNVTFAYAHPLSLVLLHWAPVSHFALVFDRAPSCHRP